jgi:hypothetical protein
MKEAVLRISLEDQMRMKAIVLDEDRDDALIFIRELLQRVEASQKLGMVSHLGS